jgi:hypothetical protein
MRNLGLVVFAVNALVILAPVFAEESNYIRLNKEHNWELTSIERLASIINNPSRYNPEELVAALHEYSRRHGVFNTVHNSLEALVNAYIAKNPAYGDWPTEAIFLWTAKSRGVPSLQNLAAVPPEEPIIEATSIDAASIDVASIDAEFPQEEDYVSVILTQLQENIPSYKLLNAGLYDDGNIFIVYQAADEIDVTISIDKTGEKYLIGTIKSGNAMREALEFLTRFYSEPIPYLTNGGSEAVFHDLNNRYIKDNAADYIGTITVYESQMFIEEVISQDKTIIQRQWCTPAFLEQCIAALGPNWGFIASWDTEE